MIKYTGEKKYEKAVIAAVEDWLRHHLPAGSTGVKLHEVELLDLDGCNIKAKVNYDINYSGVYEDEFENVTDEISFETDRAIADTFKESLQAEDEDGWGDQIEEELAQSLDFAADIAYEVRNCVRGSYVIDGDKVEDLVKSLRSLVDGLEIAIENIENDAKSINESVEKRDVFCTDCDTVTTQTYKGSFKDGIRTLGRYICDRCGCENEDEPLTESKSIKESTDSENKNFNSGDIVKIDGYVYPNGFDDYSSRYLVSGTGTIIKELEDNTVQVKITVDSQKTKKDDELIIRKMYVDSINESIKKSTKKSYVFSKNESKYSLNSK